MPSRLSEDEIQQLVATPVTQRANLSNVIHTDVLIAGSGPIACAYARTIIEKGDAKVLMAEIGARDNEIIGAHHKNSIKYQKDIDAFVNVIKGALQTISAPPGDTYIPTLGGDGWTPEPQRDVLIFQGSNPNQERDLNLKASAVTRSVGGMATHWTCACPFPHPEERALNPIPKPELDALLQKAHTLLNVHPDQYEQSMRHTAVKNTLIKALGKDRGVQSLPLAVERRTDNPDYVTWSGSNTVLGKEAAENSKFTLLTETRVTRLIRLAEHGGQVVGALLRDLKNNTDVIVFAKAYVVACGAIGTPQILANSDIGGKNLGRHLCEQSIAFCQIVLRREIVDAIRNNPDYAARIAEHKKKHPQDPLPIPFNDPEPQVMIPYSTAFPWHCQVHRDAFSYGDVGPRADSRVVVDLRFFGKQDVNPANEVYFGKRGMPMTSWEAGNTDIYGMPQATFVVRRSQDDLLRDQKMMNDMTATANYLGAYLPGSQPQFMEPGLALHITGTTRIGKDPESSVADPSSKVHGMDNVWVGGNGCIPDSTGCNPTLTSIAIALKGAESVLEHLKQA